MAQPVITARVPEALHAAISVAAESIGRSVGDIVREALARWLDELDIEQLEAQLRADMEERAALLDQLKIIRQRDLAKAEPATQDQPTEPASVVKPSITRRHAKI